MLELALVYNLFVQWRGKGCARAETMGDSHLAARWYGHYELYGRPISGHGPARQIRRQGHYFNTITNKSNLEGQYYKQIMLKRTMDIYLHRLITATAAKSWI